MAPGVKNFLKDTLMKKNLFLISGFLLLSAFSHQALAVRVTVYGAGGVSVNLQDKTSKICPDKSDGKCCEVEISGNDI